ncbi:hypothetical protein GCM10027290_44980 [Micromonospora sonneratiae]|uniref:Uncharacterized protein n=1 Tax=Micromonospora sonneratiae TaxID=1184706 RepID=A0ABW3Y6V0_9ACTN
MNDAPALITAIAGLVTALVPLYDIWLNNRRKPLGRGDPTPDGPATGTPTSGTPEAGNPSGTGTPSAARRPAGPGRRLPIAARMGLLSLAVLLLVAAVGQYFWPRPPRDEAGSAGPSPAAVTGSATPLSSTPEGQPSDPSSTVLPTTETTPVAGGGPAPGTTTRNPPGAPAQPGPAGECPSGAVGIVIGDTADGTKVNSRVIVQITMPGYIPHDDPGAVWFFVRNPAKAYFPAYRAAIRTQDTWMLNGVQLGRDQRNLDRGTWQVQAIYLYADDHRQLEAEMSAGHWNNGRPSLPANHVPLKNVVTVQRTC